ncbi:hypothetical protein SULAZ_1696 [Sulfurihydrogenibium azorense Az-Fu1]|uniref:Uncharacterized protein n=1 Tax=Sulfurihydrogenibium azorense (strain DSM 15241 / OCM 825 / Az-Fu1) TaxID=204536 RepID=C1DX17_SULAA|nr:hypothetical protein SULAZ_1696 [Sulfurihydrogenibium azorense Az-Fu1]
MLECFSPDYEGIETNMIEAIVDVDVGFSPDYEGIETTLQSFMKA